MKRGPIWRPYIKAMVATMLEHAYKTRKTFKTYQTWTIRARRLKVDHPELGKVKIRERRE